MTAGMPFDEQAKRRYAAIIARRPGRQAAAAELGFTWNTVRKHLNDDPVFAEAVREAEDLIVERVEGVLLDMAMDEHFGSVMEVLRANRPEKYAPTAVHRHVHTGAGGGPIQIAAAHTASLVAVLTDPDLRSDALELASGLPTAEQIDQEIIEATIVEDSDEE